MVLDLVFIPAVREDMRGKHGGMAKLVDASLIANRYKS